MSFSVALVKFLWFGINWYAFTQKLSFVYYYYYSENRVISRIWKVLPNMVFPPIRGKTWRRSEHAHASYPGLPLFSPARVQPLYGARRKESSGTQLRCDTRSDKKRACSIWTCKGAFSWFSFVFILLKFFHTIQQKLLNTWTFAKLPGKSVLW